MLKLTSSLVFFSSWDFKLDDLINRCFTKQRTKRLLTAVESKKMENANVKNKITLFFLAMKEKGYGDTTSLRA